MDVMLKFLITKKSPTLTCCCHRITANQAQFPRMREFFAGHHIGGGVEPQLICLREENPFGLKEYIDNIKDNRTVSEGIFILGHGLNPGV
jgi:hypothetical protein